MDDIDYKAKYEASLKRAKEEIRIKGIGETVKLCKELFPELRESYNHEYDGNMDKECIGLCDMLNSLPGVETFESCCGHFKERFSIWFFCENVDSISRLGRCVERNYSDGKWELLVDSTDTHPKGVFWLRSKEPFSSMDEMNRSVSSLIQSITHWFDEEFDNYFSNKESEDERIRKGLIAYLKADKEHNPSQKKEFYESALAYLERQKKQKLTSFNEPYNSDDYEVVVEGNATGLKRKEQNPAEVEQNSLVGMLKDKKAITEDIRNGIPTKTIEKERNVKFATPVDVSHTEWSEEEKACLNEAIETLNKLGYDGLVDNLKHLRPQPKQEWNEEDRKKILMIQSVLKAVLSPNYSGSKYWNDKQVEELYEWCENLMLRPGWKPSEEQIEALENSTALTEEQGAALYSLVQDLKKLYYESTRQDLPSREFV